MVRHLRDDPPPLPQHLEDSCWGEVVRKCMEKQPRFRIESPADIREILERRDEAEAPEWWKNAAPTEQLAHLETMERKRAGTTQQSDDQTERSASTRAIGAIIAGILVGAVVAVAFWMGRDSSPKPEPIPQQRAAALESADDEGSESLPEINDQPGVGSDPAANAGADSGSSDDETPTLNFETNQMGESDVGADADDSADSNVGDEPPSTAPATSDSRADMPSERSKPRRPAKSKQVTFTMKSTPKGARVRVDGRPIGTTPTAHEIDRDDEKVEIVFSHIGYQPQTERVVPDGDKTVEVRLEKGRLKLIP